LTDFGTGDAANILFFFSDCCSTIEVYEYLICFNSQIYRENVKIVQSLFVCVLLPISLYVLLAIVVSDHSFTVFDYTFGVFKRFLKRDRQHNGWPKKKEDENGRQCNK
jgi:hypothetical protein